MRCTQIIGLTEAAKELVSGEQISFTEVGVRTYADGRSEPFTREGERSSTRSEESGACFHGMFEGERYPLLRYELADGRVFCEAVQAEPWSSGPCIFLALRDETGEWVAESLWSEDEIAAA